MMFCKLFDAPAWDIFSGVLISLTIRNKNLSGGKVCKGRAILWSFFLGKWNYDSGNQNRKEDFFFFAYMNAEQRDFQDLICMCPSID